MEVVVNGRLAYHYIRKFSYESNRIRGKILHEPPFDTRAIQVSLEEFLPFQYHMFNSRYNEELLVKHGVLELTVDDQKITLTRGDKIVLPCLKYIIHNKSPLLAQLWILRF